MRWGSAPLVTNGSMSGNITTHGIDLQQDWIYSVQANWYGILGAPVTSGAGTFKLQVSNDNVVVVPSGPAGGTDPAVNVINWADYTGTSQAIVAANGSSSFMWNVVYPGYRWVRLVYTQSSGTGVLNVNYFGKGQ